MHETVEKIRVLVADDDADLLLLIKRQLEREGFVVKISLNGEGIAEILEEEQVDVILLDISMNGVTGDDICRMLKSHKKLSTIPIIMFSANDNVADIAGECGANGFIAKPFEVDMVKNKILQVIHSGV